MSLPVFKVGDVVIFHMDNSCGGGRYGKTGDTGTIHYTEVGLRGPRYYLNDCSDPRIDGSFAYGDCIKSLTKPYTPSQVGDKEDDI